MELIKFAFSNFWIWLGHALLITFVLRFLFLCWNRFWRHWNIRKHGYPPPHCDADGDFKPAKKDEL